MECVWLTVVDSDCLCMWACMCSYNMYEQNNANIAAHHRWLFVPCSQHCIVCLHQLPFCVTSLQLWLHPSLRRERHHLIMPGCISWQVQLLLERILNPTSKATFWIPPTSDSGESRTQFKHNRDIFVVASAKQYPRVSPNTLQQVPGGDTISPGTALISDPQSTISLQWY